MELTGANELELEGGAQALADRIVVVDERAVSKIASKWWSERFVYGEV